MRQIKLKDEKLFKILTERGKVFKEIQKINEEMIKLDTERKKLGYKMERLKDKTTKRLKKHTIELGEFEEIGTVGIELGENTVSIFDHVEEYKKMLREKKNEGNSNNSDNKK